MIRASSGEYKPDADERIETSTQVRDFRNVNFVEFKSGNNVYTIDILAADFEEMAEVWDEADLPEVLHYVDEVSATRPFVQLNVELGEDDSGNPLRECLGQGLLVGGIGCGNGVHIKMETGRFQYGYSERMLAPPAEPLTVSYMAG